MRMLSSTVDSMMLMTLDPRILSEAKAARERTLESQHQLERARADFNHEIRRLHAAGGSMREISEQLGVSHQRVHQIVADGAPDDPLLKRLGDRLQRGLGGFSRFEGEAREAVVQANNAALELGSGSVQPEHLLLGLAAPESGVSAQILRDAGVERDALRAAIEQAGGPSRKRGANGRTPFSPATKKVLELATKEAVRTGQDRVTVDALLCGLLDADAPRIGAVLAPLGVTPDAIRHALG